MFHPLAVATSLGIAMLISACEPASAQTRVAYGTVDERDARLVVERVARPRQIEYRINLIPKGGLRVNGALGIKIAAVSVAGWRFTPPLPRTFYAGSEFFDGAPEIVITAAPTRGVQEAVILLMYTLCREEACFSHDISLAITQR